MKNGWSSEAVQGSYIWA